MRRGAVQPNIGESGSKSAARALELCPRLKLTSRTEISCAAAKYPQLIYIFELFKNPIVLLINCIELIYGLWNGQNWEL